MRIAWFLSVFLKVSTIQGAPVKKRYVAPAKPKVGHDIKVGGMYHPWDDTDEKATPSTPSSDQHKIAEHLLSTIQSGDSIDRAISEFESYSDYHNMGLTLGDQKGKVIENAFSKISTPPDQSIVILEFGSHIGDGTLRILRQLNRIGDCRMFSLESNPAWLSLGSSIVRHVISASGQQDCRYIPLLLSRDIESVADYLKEHHGIDRVDGIFLDHVHGKFYSDLNLLNEKGLLHTGTVIVADNALRHKQVMSQFIDFVRDNSETFSLADVSNPYPDQILCAEWRDSRSRRDEL